MRVLVTQAIMIKHPHNTHACSGDTGIHEEHPHNTHACSGDTGNHD